MSNLSFGRGDQDSNLRLDTLIRVRWLAVAGQTITVMVVAFILRFDLNMPVCLALIACSAWLNVFLGLRFRTNLRLNSNWTVALLAYDIVQLSALLYVTGGLENPFAILLVVPVVVSSTTQTIRSTQVLGMLTVLAASLLTFLHDPLPWYPGEALSLPVAYVVGMWFAIVSCLGFTATYAFQVANEARKLSNALSATELVLQREQHLSALDGLAAAAAHELGTPLATIALVSKEMLHELPETSPLYEDAQLLRSQAARCRDILQKLTSLPSEGDLHIGRLALSSMMEEVVAPHRNFGIEIVMDLMPLAGEPVFSRNPGILYGLGNLIENAVDFARTKVEIKAFWDEKLIMITLADDGPGFPADLIDRIGDPYISTRSTLEAGHGGGLGLGLFIAKTLIERSGATIAFSNAPTKPVSEGLSGALVTIVWKRAFIAQADANRGDPDRFVADQDLSANHDKDHYG